MKIAKYFLVFVMTLGVSAQAQTNVISRTTPAVNYGHRHSNTPIDFRGTDLMPTANGQADVRSNRGTMEVKAEFGELQKPQTFGRNEYLTYVLWAISPEGSPTNLGEVLVGDNHRSKLDVTTNLQAFAMIVTAEPYYAVRRPSNVVVLENAISVETNGTTEPVNAKYELIGRGGYIPTGYNFDAVVLDAKLPLEFFEARNAVHIAHSRRGRQLRNRKLRKGCSPDERGGCSGLTKARRQQDADFRFARSGADGRRRHGNCDEEDGNRPDGCDEQSSGGRRNECQGSNRSRICRLVRMPKHKLPMQIASAHGQRTQLWMRISSVQKPRKPLLTRNMPPLTHNSRQRQHQADS